MFTSLFSANSLTFLDFLALTHLGFSGKENLEIRKRLLVEVENAYEGTRVLCGFKGEGVMTQSMLYNN